MHFLKRLIIAIRGTHAREIHQSQYFLNISSSESTISDLRSAQDADSQAKSAWISGSAAKNISSARRHILPVGAA